MGSEDPRLPDVRSIAWLGLGWNRTSRFLKQAPDVLGRAGCILKPRWSRERDRRVEPRSAAFRTALDFGVEDPDLAITAPAAANRDVANIAVIAVISGLRVLKAKSNTAARDLCGDEPVNLLSETTEEYETTPAVGLHSKLIHVASRRHAFPYPA